MKNIFIQVIVIFTKIWFILTILLLYLEAIVNKTAWDNKRVYKYFLHNRVFI